MTTTQQDSTQQEVALIERLIGATDRKGVGPKLGLDIMETISAIVPPMLAMIADDPDHGAESVARAVAYAKSRAEDRHRHAEETEARRKAAREAKTSDEEEDETGPLPVEPTAA